MIERLLGLPPHLRERLAVALEAGVLSTGSTSVTLRSVLGRDSGIEVAIAALREFDRLATPGRAGAAWIRSLDAVQGRVPRSDLVWSGPGVPGLHSRNTRRVYEELIGGAEHSVWVSTYAFFDGPTAFASLARRMDQVPNLQTLSC